MKEALYLADIFKENFLICSLQDKGKIFFDVFIFLCVLFFF